MNRRLSFYASAFVASLAVAACSSGSGSGGGNQQGTGAGTGSSGGGGGTSSSGAAASSGGGSCKVMSACSIVTEGDVSKAVGADLGAGSEQDANTQPSMQKAELVTCNFGSNTGGEVNVSVRCCPCGDNDANAVESEYKSLGQTVTPVSGVGDTAFWTPQDPQKASAGGTLYAFSGADLQVTVTVTSPVAGPFPQDPQAAAVSLATAALAAQ